MPSIIQIAANAQVAKLISADNTARDLVANTLSYFVDGREFMQSFKTGSWNGRSSFYSHTTQTFPAGFVHLVHNQLVSAGYQVQIVRRPLPSPLGDESPIVDEFGNDDPRYDYQLQAMRQVERHGRGIVRVATGGGKSKIARLVVGRFKRMTLLLTTRQVLMEQNRAGFEKAGYKVGVVGDGQWTPTRGVNVGMVQTLVAKLKQLDLATEARAILQSNIKAGITQKREEIIAAAQRRVSDQELVRARTIKFLELVEVVIGEEAHEAGGTSYYEILRHCKNANIRVALTATPFMRESTEDNMRLMAAFGPVLIDVPEKLLIDRGILATPYFKFHACQPHPKLRKTSPYQRARTLGIVENDFRNRDALNYAKKAASLRIPTMILVKELKHGAIMHDLMQDAGLRSLYIRGETSNDQRQIALKKLGAGEIDVLIGTNILDVGVDVPAVGMIILLGGGKAEVGHRQRIGRGLRAKKAPLPNVAFIVDFIDDVNLHLRDHARQRRAIVEATPGFAENVLAPNQDFDWSRYNSINK